MNSLLELASPEQKRALTRMELTDVNVFIAWWKMGTGKTRLALLAFALSNFSHAIIVTRRVAFYDWIQEVNLCKLNFTIFLNSFETKNCKQLGRKDKTILLLSGGDLKNIPDNYPKGEMLIVDELYLFSNPKAKRSKLLRNLSLFCSARIGLSGTIMPAQDNFTIFGQLMALNAHRLLARNATEFRSRFQIAMQTGFGRMYMNRPGSKDEISKLLSAVVDLNFPETQPLVRQIVKVTKTPKQKKAIDELKKYYEFDGKEFEYATQIVHAVNGISNGWWLKEDGSLEYLECGKFDKLEALLDELTAEGQKVVVWCAYHNDIQRIASKTKHSYLEFTGKNNFDIDKWNKDKANIVLATEANGASVNHFAQVKYAIYYSINWFLLDLEQSMMRHERKSSQHGGAHFYFLQTAGTYDARTYQLVNEAKLKEKELISTLVVDKNLLIE